MSRPRFLADEDLRREIVLATIRGQREVEFASVVQSGLAGEDDEVVLEYAASNGWIVVSHDVNTMRATAERRIATGLVMCGLLLVPQSRPTRPVAESLVLIWSASEAEEWVNRVAYLPI